MKCLNEMKDYTVLQWSFELTFLFILAWRGCPAIFKHFSVFMWQVNPTQTVHCTRSNERRDTQFLSEYRLWSHFQIQNWFTQLIIIITDLMITENSPHPCMLMVHHDRERAPSLLQTSQKTQLFIQAIDCWMKSFIPQ